MIVEYILSTKQSVILFMIAFLALFYVLFDTMSGLIYYYYARDTSYVGKVIAIKDDMKVSSFFKPVIGGVIVIPYFNNGLIIRGKFMNLAHRVVKYP